MSRKNRRHIKRLSSVMSGTKIAIAVLEPPAIADIPKTPQVIRTPIENTLRRSTSQDIVFNKQQQVAYDGISDILDKDEFLVVLNSAAGSGKSMLVKQIIRDNPDKNFHIVSLAAVAAMPYGDLSTDDAHVSTRAQSVFGNLFTQDINEFTKSRIGKWKSLQSESTGYVPDIQVTENNSESVVNDLLNSSTSTKESLGVDFFEWFTCEAIIHAYDNWRNRYNIQSKKNNAILIVEEYSMVSILSLFGWMYPRVILVGDKNQLPAIESLPDPNTTYVNAIQPTVNNAYACFKTMIERFAERMKNAKCFRLTKNERDPSHQEWYDWLYDFVEGRANHPSKNVQGIIDGISCHMSNVNNIPVEKGSIYLCDTNRARHIITNKYHTLFHGSIRTFRPIPATTDEKTIQECLKHQETVRFARYCANDNTIKPTSIQQLIQLICERYTRFVVTASVGGSIMVTKNKKGAYYNGEIYTLNETDGKLSIGEISLPLPYDTLESTGDTRLRINQWITALTADRVEIPISAPVFQEANVMTIHKAQGQTLAGKVCVVLTSPWFCSKQMLYTAATRCRNVEDLKIYTDMPFDKKFIAAPKARLSLEKAQIIQIVKTP